MRVEVRSEQPLLTPSALPGIPRMLRKNGGILSLRTGAGMPGLFFGHPVLTDSRSRLTRIPQVPQDDRRDTKRWPRVPKDTAKAPKGSQEGTHSEKNKKIANNGRILKGNVDFLTLLTITCSIILRSSDVKLCKKGDHPKLG